MHRLLLKSPNCQDLRIDADQLEIKQFPDGESHVRIPKECRGMNAVVIHRCYPSQDTSLLQLFFAIRELKDSGVMSASAVIPYLPYARQDKRVVSGEALSSVTVCRLLRESGCDRLVTFDCHFLKQEGNATYGGLHISNKSLGPLVAAHLKKGLEKPLVISPDEGARYLTSSEKETGVMKKVRGGYPLGKSAYREVSSLKAEFSVKGRDVIIVDDIIAGGSTMIRALRLCMEQGAKSVRCGAVHGLFLNDSYGRLLDEGAEQVVCTNSINSVPEAAKADMSEAIKKAI